MLVPRYWAEHRIQLREGRGPQTTIRRWGWSAESQAAADHHARERAEAVAAEVRAGRKLSFAERRERKVAYNGADGVPIREEILSEFPELDAVVTRNQYGAHCLNVSDVLFADIDLDPRSTLALEDGCVGCLMIALVAAGIGMSALQLWWMIIPIATVATGLILWRIFAHIRLRQRLASTRWVDHRVKRWCSDHPTWTVHLYRTPAGYRLLVTHALFSPASDEVATFFRYFETDPRFVRMCRSQSCFRARLTGKPWRMGVTGKMGWGTWPPTSAEAHTRREQWIAGYESAAANFAACRYLSHVGSTSEHPRAVAIRRLHDEACRAQSELPLA